MHPHRRVGDVHLIPGLQVRHLEERDLVTLCVLPAVLGHGKVGHVLAIHQMLSVYAPAVFAQVDFVPVVLDLAPARVDKPHEGIASAEWTLIRERTRHPPRGFVHAHRKRRSGKQLRHARRWRSLENKRHEVVLLIVERVRDVLAVRRCHRKAARDPLRHTNDAVVLSVQLRHHPDRKRL